MAFLGEANRRHQLGLASYRDLHAWSVKHPELFWDLLWDFAGVIGEKGARLATDLDAMPGAKFFPDAKLNFAENLLRRTDARDALVFRGEDKRTERMTFAQLAALLSRLQQALKALGVGVGDRVAGMMPNMPATIAAMLATTSLGAVWSSCSPDFGERGVLDRFGQIEPKVFFTVDGYWYNGKALRIADKLRPVIEKLPSAQTAVIVPYLGEAEDVAKRLPRAQTLEALIAP
jgi:acetoacetyl-CoA synthetase